MKMKKVKVKRLRLSVFRSNRYIYAQLIDDSLGKTLMSAHEKEVTGKTPLERAQATGELLAKRAKAKKVRYVLFDRGGFAYHGRVAALAKGARIAGLDF